jgi:hypothetical protein
MSALPPKADIRQRNCDVRFGPQADIPLLSYRTIRTRAPMDQVRSGRTRADGTQDASIA